MKKILLYICSTLVLWGCGGGPAADDPIAIRWDAPAELPCSDIRAIPLETNSETFIGRRSCCITHLTGRYIVGDDDKVLIYDRQGRIETVIAARGRGPQEAYDMRHIAATDSTLLVADLGRCRMLEFGFDGSFRRVWPTVRPFHSFVWFAGALLLDNQTGMHHDDCVLPVCDAEGNIVHTPCIPIVGKELNWPSSFFHDRHGCYYMPALQNCVYLITDDFEAQAAYTFDFGMHGIDPDVCEKYAGMENLFVAFADYLRENDKIAFVSFAQTEQWLQLGFSIGYEKRFNWFMNRDTGRQYLIPVGEPGTSPWNHEVIGADGDRFIVRVEAAAYRRWPSCRIDNLTDDSNPVLLACRPQEE